MSIEITHFINKVLDPNKDSLVLGTPGKWGELKVYGDFNNPEDFIKRIDNAIALLKYANEAVTVAKASEVQYITAESPQE